MGRARRVAFDAHGAIDEDSGNVGRGDQVLQVVIGLASLLYLRLQFRVDGDEFLVHRLQLFLAGFEFLGRRSQLFVDRLQFFIGRLQLFRRRLVLLDRGLQLFLARMQLLFELLHHGVVARLTLRGRLGFRHRFLHLVEQHEEEVGVGGGVVEGAHGHVDVRRVTVALQLDAPGLHAIARLRGLEQRGTQVEPQFGQHDGNHVARRFAADIPQETSRVVRHMHDLRIAVDDHARRRVLLEHALV